MTNTKNAIQYKILLINGPNINMLGKREQSIYGNATYDDLIVKCKNFASDNQIDLDIYQSNHEGEIIDKLQESLDKIDGIIINPAAYSHTSIAILDSLIMHNIPIIEIHISDVTKREDFRKKLLTANAATELVSGKGIDGYIIALRKILCLINA